MSALILGALECVIALLHVFYGFLIYLQLLHVLYVITK